ncbi:hypothetical protein BDR04DRAFT_1398 [Suillus decipiens]|nr:hypothetical protein BDR04DRAFT_1398 [Suillus decipiens]
MWLVFLGIVFVYQHTTMLWIFDQVPGRGTSGYSSDIACLPPSADKAWDNPNSKLGSPACRFCARLCHWAMDDQTTVLYFQGFHFSEPDLFPLP